MKENKIIRRLEDGFHWLVNLNWIKKEIVKGYFGSNKKDMERKLIINKSISDYGQIGYIFYALEGSPPKGCAIYMPSRKWLKIISNTGKVRNLKDILIKNE